MNLSNEIKEKLKKNWGVKAESMNCYSEIKFVDVMSNWDCYIFALNPENDEEIYCLVKTDFILEVVLWSLQDLYKAYNTDGEHPVIDKEFRRIRVSELFKKLSEGR